MTDDIYQPTHEPNMENEIWIVPNYDLGITPEDIIKIIEKSFTVNIIQGSQKKYDPARIVFVKAPINSAGTFMITLTRTFVEASIYEFLDVCREIILKNYVRHFNGTISYAKDNMFIFINLSAVINGSIDVYSNIFSNYSKIDCLFKHKNNDMLYLFCETKSPLIKEKLVNNIFGYFHSIGLNNNSKRIFTGHIYMTKTQKAVIRLATERSSAITREIFADSVEVGLEIIKKELKNLGFEMVRFEKRDEWSYGT